MANSNNGNQEEGHMNDVEEFEALTTRLEAARDRIHSDNVTRADAREFKQLSRAVQRRRRAAKRVRELDVFRGGQGSPLESRPIERLRKLAGRLGVESAGLDVTALAAKLREARSQHGVEPFGTSNPRDAAVVFNTPEDEEDHE